MADPRKPAGVLLSRRLVSETPRHPALGRDSRKTFVETPGLEALACSAHGRDTRRDRSRDRVSRGRGGNSGVSLSRVWGSETPETASAALRWEIAP
jgi:hypothetical protein